MSHILLVHGAWGGAWEFEATIKGLQERGHTASAIDLPGHGEFKAPISEVTMDTYVQTTVDAVNAIDGPVILVGHSLGGAVISQVGERLAASGKLERLVYVAAMLPAAGESPLALMQGDGDGKLLPLLEFSEDQTSVRVGPEAVKSVLLNDVTEPERLAEFLPHFDMSQATEPFMFEAKLTEAAFGQVPRTYIRASVDLVLSPALQDQMIANWTVDEVVTLDSGHFPLMSMPDQLIDAVAQTAGLRA